MKKIRKVWHLGALLVFVLWSAVAYGDQSTDYWPKDSWRAAVPEEQGVDSGKIAAMLQYVKKEHLNLHGFLMIRHGYLVAETYFHPYSRTFPNPVYSCTKSVISALTGIAVKEGDLPGVQAQVLDQFRDEYRETANPPKRRITIQQLLTMSSGLQPVNTFQFSDKPDPVQYLLRLPLVGKPGEKFAYSCSGPHLLTALLKNKTGCDVMFYARQKLFEPMGIAKYGWAVDPQGVHYGSTGLQLTAPDMARLGYLYLRQGRWNGQQLIPADWIRESTAKHIETPEMNVAENMGYGYGWWIDSAWDGFSAHGFGGQYIFVVPKLDLVVVFTGGLENSQFPIPQKLMAQYLIPAVHPQSLPANPALHRKLAALLDEIQNPPPQKASPQPETARKMTGRTFCCDKNILSVAAFRWDFSDPDQAELKLALPADPDRWLTIPIGLDGLYRRSEEPGLGEVYARGEWRDERTFQMGVIQPEGPLHLEIRFAGNEAAVLVAEYDQAFTARSK